MKRTAFNVTLTVLFALAYPVNAQLPMKSFKVGVISSGSASQRDDGFEMLRSELRAIGSVEGKNILFEARYYEGKLDRLPAIAEDLIRNKVDLILTSTTPSTKAAKRATATIPIVFTTQADPVVALLVKTLARPGGNATGFTRITPLLAGKRLELLKETVPKLSRVAVLWTPRQSDQSWEES